MNSSRAGYRPAGGLFPPLHTAMDYVPVPSYIRFSPQGLMLRVGIDGVEYVAASKFCDQAEADNLVRAGLWTKFDPDNVEDWGRVISGPPGDAVIVTTRGAWALPYNLFTVWQAAGAARDAQLNCEVTS